MCGRYHFSRDVADDMMVSILNTMDRKYSGRFKTGELCPGDSVPGIISWHDKIVPVPAIFGFPGFKDNKLLINARAETAAEKISFAESLQQRRIVLPATAFYEWSHDRKNQKYLFALKGQSAMYLCGIYKKIEGTPRFVILTREASASVAEIHNRMPVIISEYNVRRYLTDYHAALDIISFQPPILERQVA